jgi:hypothetical protein
MTRKEILAAFDEYERTGWRELPDYLPSGPLDLEALVLLDRLVPGKTTLVLVPNFSVYGSERVKLSVTLEELAGSEVSPSDIRTLIRGGVRLDLHNNLILE